jgi:hypothetical protein
MNRDRLKIINRRISEAEGTRKELQRNRDRKHRELSLLQKRARMLSVAHGIVLNVGEALQARVSLRLSTTASHALATVFEKPYQVRVNFAPTGRGSIDATVMFERDGNEFRPVLPNGQLLAGGGPVELAAFGICFALWGQQPPRTRPIFFRDEPFRFIAKERLTAVAEVLRNVGIQIIAVTHEPELIAEADNVIEL